MKTLFIYLLFVSFGLNAQTQTYDLANDKIMNENYPFKVLQSEQVYTNKVGDYLFYAEPEFIDFCNAAFGLDSRIPFVDFNEETAVVTFKSLSKPSSRLFVDNVVETEHFIKVFVKNTDTPGHVRKKYAINQYLIMKVKKSNKEIRVIHVTS